MPITLSTNPENGKDPHEALFDDPNIAKIQDVLDNPVLEEHYKEHGDEVAEEPILEKLTLRQERFCQLYALDARFMGNGVQAYMEVYDVDTEKANWYKTACSMASRMLSNAKVFGRINDLLETNGLNDAFADKQLLYLMSQQDDKTAKMAAIKEYNKVRARIIEKVEVNNINSQLTPEQLNEAILNAIR